MLIKRKFAIKFLTIQKQYSQQYSLLNTNQIEAKRKQFFFKKNGSNFP